MALNKYKFVTGRGTYNREAQLDVMCIHCYNPAADETVTELKTPGYFNGVSEFLVSGDIIWVNNYNANPYQLTVDAITPDITVQEIQTPIISGIINTLGGSPNEAYFSGLPDTTIPIVTINTDNSAGTLTVLETFMQLGQVVVNYNIDPTANSKINVVLFPAII